MGRQGECEWGGEESVSVEVSGDSLSEPDSHMKSGMWDVRGEWVVVKLL